MNQETKTEATAEIRKRLSRKEFLGLGAAGMGMVALAGCGSAGSGSSSGSKSLTLGSIGWTENVAVSTLTKIVMEKNLGYKVNINGPLDLGPLFQGVAGGDLDTFQDVWLPNNQNYLDKPQIKPKVELLPPWYQGETKYDIAVPSYMKIKSIADLGKTGLNQITGIEAGASINPQIKNKVFPEYGLKNFKLVTSSTAGMLSQLQKDYKAKQPIIFLAWSPHWMNVKYDITYLKDPKDALGSFNNPAKIRAVINKDLKKNDPKAYAFLKAIKLDEKQVNDIELEMTKAGEGNETKGVRNWLKSNQSVVKPWVQAAKKA